MKLSYDGFSGVFEWNQSEIPVLTIEAKLTYRQFIKQLINFKDQNKLQFIDNHEKAVTNVHVISSPLDLEFNNQQTNRYLSKILEEKVIEDYELKIEIENYLREIIYDKLSDLSVQIDIADEMNVKQLLKLFEVVIIDDSDTDIERIINFIELIETVVTPSIYIFINLKDYFTADELDNLYNYSMLNEIEILLIENQYSQFNLEKSFIIDDDGCEIY